MKRGEGKGNVGGLTRVEVLAIFGVIAVLIGILIPRFAAAFTVRHRESCSNHQKDLGLGFRVFAADHGDHLPFEVGTNSGGSFQYASDASQAWRHFAAAMMAENIAAGAAFCPSDRNREPAHGLDRFTNNAHLSYFLVLNANPEPATSVLLGDRDLVVDGVQMEGRVVQFSSNIDVRFSGRSHTNFGQVTMEDGSVQQVGLERVKSLFSSMGNSPKIVFP